MGDVAQKHLQAHNLGCNVGLVPLGARGDQQCKLVQLCITKCIFTSQVSIMKRQVRMMYMMYLIRKIGHL